MARPEERGEQGPAGARFDAPGRGAAGHYRADIDGLRALAVLAVIAFHVAPGDVPGGFVGVDIFFVISGFLISGIVLRQLQEGRFSFLDFYRRRIRRIFPALFLVLACAFAAAWFLLPDRDFERFGTQLAGSAAFVPNFIFWGEAGYFDVYPYSKPLLHLWSLGVEEQYYAVWPLLLFLFCRWRLGLLFPVLLVALISFAFSLHQSFADPIAAFYSPLTRFWELMLGAIAAILARRGLGAPPSLAGFAASAGLLMIAAGLALIHADRAFPGWWALLPTVGTFLILIAGTDAWPNARLLSRPILVWVGLISYPLYLWHWALLSFAFTLNLDVLPPLWRIAVAASSFPLAWATYVLVERPIRFGRHVPVWGLVLAMIALLGAGLAVRAAHGVPARQAGDDSRREFLSLYRNLHIERAHGEECSFGDPARGLRTRVLPRACTAPGPRGTWLLWGDSHARALAPGLADAMPEGVALARVTTGGCPPFLPERRWQPPVCTFANAYALDQVARLKPRIVLLADRGDRARGDWRGVALRLRQAGAGRVVLVGPNPQWTEALPAIVVGRYWPDVPERGSRYLSQQVLAADRTLARRYDGSPDFTYVSLARGLCDPAGCRVRVPGGGPPRLMVSDKGHLTPWGSRFVARTIVLPALREPEKGAISGK